MSEQKVVQATETKPVLPKQPEVNIGTVGHVDHGKCLRWDEYILLDGVPMTGGEIMSIVQLKGKSLSATIAVHVAPPVGWTPDVFMDHPESLPIHQGVLTTTLSSRIRIRQSPWSCKS